LGIPTGIDLNFESKSNSINSILSWGIPDLFYFSTSYHENFRLETSEDVPGILRLYFGGGVLFRVTAHDAKFGFRIPLGIKFFFNNSPLDVFAEVAPGIHLVPETTPLIEGAIGVRFYLDRLKLEKE